MSGHAADPAIPVMNSRRRIPVLKFGLAFGVHFRPSKQEIEHAEIGDHAQFAPQQFRAAYDRSGSCMDGARGAREKNLTFCETIRVQSCIRPLNQPFWLRALM